MLRVDSRNPQFSQSRGFVCQYTIIIEEITTRSVKKMKILFQLKKKLSDLVSVNEGFDPRKFC
jgi:hypothetical protein